MPPILEVRGLSKSFGGLHAVAAVDFSVATRGILGIAGPNGSGKSTLFNVLTRIPFGADSGVVLFEGREIQSLRAHRIARLGLARTFQRESVFPGLSAIDNVLLAVENSDTTARFPQRVAQAQRSLDEVGFPATLHNSPAGQLPIFLRKLVMIASALALQPRLLLLDEPASSLTAQEIERIKAQVVRAHWLIIVVSRVRVPPPLPPVTTPAVSASLTTTQQREGSPMASKSSDVRPKITLACRYRAARSATTSPRRTVATTPTASS